VFTIGDARRARAAGSEEAGMGLRRRRGGNDDDRHVRFQMREKLISIGDDYWIEDDAGRKWFKVNGKALRLRDTWVIEDPSGHEVATIRERKLSVRDAIKIECDGRSATVKKALVGIRDRFNVDVERGDDLKVHGNIVDHEYEIERDGHKVAEISKKWFRVRDSYGVEVYDVADAPLALAVTVAVDAMSHDVG
jgi:uncharacterized protein YxjI